MRLGGEDTAWLHMEDETNPMIVNAIIELDGTLDTARVWSIVEARGMPPRFRSRVIDSGRGLPRLELDPAFDVSKHLVHVEIEPGDEALRSFVSREVSTLLDKNHPLWRTIVIDREGASTAILFRVHHSLADGFALLERLYELCDEGAQREPPQATHGAKRSGVVKQAEALARMVALPPDPRTTLKRELGVEKNVAWSRPFPLDLVKRVARSTGATVNDVLMSVVSGAIGRQLESFGEMARDVRAMVPVNLRRAANVGEELGNRFGLVILALPVGMRDPAMRLAEVKHRMDEIKSSPEAFVGMDLLQLMGWLPRSLETLGASFFAKKASLVLTNVPGPREPLHLGGVTISRIMFWVPQAARLGLGVSIFSYAGHVTLGVIADAHVLEKPESLVDAMNAEMIALARVELRRAS